MKAAGGFLPAGGKNTEDFHIQKVVRWFFEWFCMADSYRKKYVVNFKMLESIYYSITIALGLTGEKCLIKWKFVDFYEKCALRRLKMSI